MKSERKNLIEKNLFVFFPIEKGQQKPSLHGIANKNPFSAEKVVTFKWRIIYAGTRRLMAPEPLVDLARFIPPQE